MSRISQLCDQQWRRFNRYQAAKSDDHACSEEHAVVMGGCLDCSSEDKNHGTDEDCGTSTELVGQVGRDGEGNDLAEDCAVGEIAETGASGGVEEVLPLVLDELLASGHGTKQSINDTLRRLFNN